MNLYAETDVHGFIICGCTKPEPLEDIPNPYHMQKARCKNCGHLIYYQNDHWEHWTRAYRPHGYPYTTMKCYARLGEDSEAEKIVPPKEERA